MHTYRGITAILISGTWLLTACGDDGGGSTTPDAAIDSAPPSADAMVSEEIMTAMGIWEDIDGANEGFKQFAEMPGSEGVIADTSGVHGMFRQVFLDETAAASLSSPQTNAVIVKVNLNSNDATDIAAVTVMKKITGFDPDNEDWFWAKFLPNGDLDQDGDGNPLAGKVAGCLGCHSNDADTGGDYVFLNADDQLTFGSQADIDRAKTLWDTINADGGYEAWNGFDGNPGADQIRADTTGQVHGMFNRIFLNDTGETNTADLPLDTIIVKENLNNEDKDSADFKDSVTAMQKIDGYGDADGNGFWFFAKWDTSGNLLEGPKGIPLAGQIGKGTDIGCLGSGCHGNKTGTGDDFVFENNP